MRIRETLSQTTSTFLLGTSIEEINLVKNLPTVERFVRLMNELPQVIETLLHSINTKPFEVSYNSCFKVIKCWKHQNKPYVNEYFIDIVIIF